jgi:MAX-like protein X
MLATDYIQDLEKEEENYETQLETLQKEVQALKIMKANYDELLKYHRNAPKDDNIEKVEDLKFNLVCCLNKF